MANQNRITAGRLFSVAALKAKPLFGVLLAAGAIRFALTDEDGASETILPLGRRGRACAVNSAAGG